MNNGLHNDIISFSHNDLDMLGCELVLHWKFGNNITYFNTNYRNIVEITQNIEDEINKNPPKVIIIADVSMAQNKKELLRLASHNIPVILLDHHQYPVGWFDNLPANVTYNHTHDKCGAQLTYDFFKCDEPKLKALIEIVNVYDLWRQKDSLFNTAFDMNSYFWEVGRDNMFEGIINNNYKLPENYLKTVARIKEEIRIKIQKLKDKKLLFKANNISIAFTDDLLNEIVIEEMNNGSEVVLVCTSWGGIRVRIDQECSLTKDMKMEIKSKMGCEAIGHLNAFPKIVENSTFKKLMEEVQNIVKIIEDVRSSYGN